MKLFVAGGPGQWVLPVIGTSQLSASPRSVQTSAPASKHGWDPGPFKVPKLHAVFFFLFSPIFLG